MARRDEILQAAVGLARDGGMGRVSVRAVAAAAGVGATTLRHYFPTQTDLHEAVARELIKAAVGARSMSDDTADPVERLVDGLWQFVPAPENQAAFLEGWFSLHRLALGPDGDQSARAVLRSADREAADMLRGWMDTLADQGHLARQDIPVQVIVGFALLDGLALHTLIDPDRIDRAAAREAIQWFAEHVILPRTRDR